MKRKRIKIPTITAKHLIPPTLQIHVFTEEAEAALNRAIHCPMTGSSPKSDSVGRVGCAWWPFSRRCVAFAKPSQYWHGNCHTGETMKAELEIPIRRHDSGALIPAGLQVQVFTELGEAALAGHIAECEAAQRSADRGASESQLNEMAGQGRNSTFQGG